MADDPRKLNELDDAEEAKLVAEADEGEETLPEFADARDAGAGDTLADAGEGAHIEGVVRAGLTLVPEVTVEGGAAVDERTVDRDLPAVRADDVADRSTVREIEDRPNA